MPIVRAIRKRNIIKEFPDKTEGDLYLWVLDHQHYLESQEGMPLQPPDAAARDFFGIKGNQAAAVNKNKQKTEKK